MRILLTFRLIERARTSIVILVWRRLLTAAWLLIEGIRTSSGRGLRVLLTTLLIVRVRVSPGLRSRLMLLLLVLTLTLITLLKERTRTPGTRPRVPRGRFPSSTILTCIRALSWPTTTKRPSQRIRPCAWPILPTQHCLYRLLLRLHLLLLYLLVELHLRLGLMLPHLHRLLVDLQLFLHLLLLRLLTDFDLLLHLVLLKLLRHVLDLLQLVRIVVLLLRLRLLRLLI